MMRIKILLVLLITITCLSATTTAQKKANQRVQNGIKTGEVTMKEATKIREERKDLKTEVKEAKADSIITKSEAKDIQEERIEANKAIRRSKHNAKKRK